MILALLVLLWTGGGLARGRNSTPAHGHLRLADGDSMYEGRVEVFYNGRWGTVCDNQWVHTDAEVVCRQLGLPWDNAHAGVYAFYRVGDGSIAMVDVNCAGNESRLIECPHLDEHRCRFYGSASVVCGTSYVNGNLRLVDGTNENEGRVEVYYDGAWGTVCDRGWDDRDARVVCRQLVLPSETAVARRTAYFGEGTGTVILDRVRCSGTESRLLDCSTSALFISTCTHYRDASVVCGSSAEGDLRLTGGSSKYEGRVEIFFKGTWSTVCNDYWEEGNAAVVCRQLGLPTINARVLQVGSFRRGRGPIALDNVLCFGTETRLLQCSIKTTHNCRHHQDVAVSCAPVAEGNLRLTGGNISYEGRVEIFYKGSWSMVCDDSWDDNDTGVVCRQLGLPTEGAVVLRNAYLPEGSTGTIALGDVQCLGTERSLMDCPAHTSPKCDRYDVVSVVCKGVSIRLADGGSGREGRVEVYVRGEWGTVCDDTWGLNDAAVVCRQLGFINGPFWALRFAYFGAGIGTIALDEVQCLGTESSLMDCPTQTNHNCRHFEDASVVCQGHTQGHLRLVNGTSRKEGRVEVYINGKWGTVCDDSWGSLDAEVVCRELGFVGAGAQGFAHAYFGQGTGYIVMDDVQCSGYEAHLVDCIFSFQNNCRHYEDASVICEVP